MKNLSYYLNNNLRIIEFSHKNSILSDQNTIRHNLLFIVKNRNCNDKELVSLSKSDYYIAIKKNSSDVIIINSAGWNTLKSLQNTAEARLYFERISLFNIVPITYFLVKGLISQRVKFNGIFYLKRRHRTSLYLGLKKRRKKKKVTRHYLSPLVNVEEFFQELKKKNISYCILRWFNSLPEIEANEDVDILVEDKDLTKVYSVIDKKPGIIPFDIYSKTGLPGSDFNNLPYYVYQLAEKVLEESILFKKVYKVPTAENYFYLLAYHVVFHKGENSGIKSKKYDVIQSVKSDHEYLYHLKEISSNAKLGIKEFTLDGLHNYLNTKGFVPPLDTQYKLSLKNKYLKAYLEDVHHQSELLKKYEGLVCFVIREKIVDAGLLKDVLRFVQKEGFAILQTLKIDEGLINVFSKLVRGGNWNQGPWPSNAGSPSAIIVAFDILPVKPDPDDHKQHPGLTNKRILSKTEIRKNINKLLPNESEWCNGIHSSDNEIQAVEYLTLAGLNKEIILESITKIRNDFKTQYPVLKVLSCYSRRAKIELISYMGARAIQKTFKPSCESFLNNEIEAYTIFKDVKEVPNLLEVGKNYIVTSYIEGSKPLGNRIDIRTLQRCLNLLRRIYDRGYSLLDFKPSNFLVDKNKNIHLIDFEFLHKYDKKPPFLECFDLIGPPTNIDLLNRPIVKIPKNKKQFDVKWGSFTGIRYNELSKIHSPQIYFKSLYSYYHLKIKKKLRILTTKYWQGIRVIFNTLP